MTGVEFTLCMDEFVQGSSSLYIGQIKFVSSKRQILESHANISVVTLPKAVSYTMRAKISEQIIQSVHHESEWCSESEKERDV